MAKAKGKVVVRKDRCKGCELCKAVCPKNCFTMHDDLNARGVHYAVFDEKAGCIACLNCYLACPDLVLEVFKLNEE